jgi:2-phospho-L-lactate/phosphoenolpyruvate guanylyltransferase
MTAPESPRRTFAILPVKRFVAAKQRLGEGLSAGTRRVLAEAMVGDVLIALRRASRVDRVVVVTGEPAAQALAGGHGAEVLDDPDDAGHNEAAARGVGWARERGAACVVLVPGDCPALDPAELDALLEDAGEGPRVTVVPDRHGTGTNALVLSPPDVIEPAFGPGSRARHEEAARAAGADCRVAEPSSLALDVDTLEDLDALREALAARTGGAANTRGLLKRIARR